MDSEKVSRDNTVMDFKTLNNFEENEDVRLLERTQESSCRDEKDTGIYFFYKMWQYKSNHSQLKYDAIEVKRNINVYI